MTSLPLMTWFQMYQCAHFGLFRETSVQISTACRYTTSGTFSCAERTVGFISCRMLRNGAVAFRNAKARCNYLTVAFLWPSITSQCTVVLQKATECVS